MNEQLLFQYRRVKETFRGILAVTFPRGPFAHAHRSSLGIGWRKGANRCKVPPGLSKHASKGKVKKADRQVGVQSYIATQRRLCSSGFW